MILNKVKLSKKIFLNNRVIISPMCQYSSINGSPSSWHYKHLSSLTTSGASMLVLESTAINKAGRITKNDLCLYNKKHFHELRKLIKFLKSLSKIPICIQLSHSGRKGSSNVPWVKKNSSLEENIGWTTISSSKLKKDISWPYPKEASIKDINQIILDFYKSAKLAISAGCDGIEIHMAHGYLLHQFLSPISNKRKDEYGGSFKNRSKLAIKVAKKIKKLINNKAFLGARITGSDHLKGGIQTEEGVLFAKELEKIGLNYFCVSSGGILTKTGLNSTKRGFRINLAKKIKKNTKNILVGTTGKLEDLFFLERIFKKKIIDFAFIGRPFLKNPNWLYKYIIKKNKRELIPNQYLRGFF